MSWLKIICFFSGKIEKRSTNGSMSSTNVYKNETQTFFIELLSVKIHIRSCGNRYAAQTSWEILLRFNAKEREHIDIQCLVKLSLLFDEHLMAKRFRNELNYVCSSNFSETNWCSTQLPWKWKYAFLRFSSKDLLEKSNIWCWLYRIIELIFFALLCTVYVMYIKVVFFETCH